MLHFAADAVISFSTAPLRLATLLGLTTCVLATILLAYHAMIGGESNIRRVISGWSSVMTAISFFAGVQLLMLGILGECLSRLVHEVQARPLFLIDRVTTGDREFQPPGNFAQLSSSQRKSLFSAPEQHAHDLIQSRRFESPES
jgi:dolichol-phosphate mannosyltransferase